MRAGEAKRNCPSFPSQLPFPSIISSATFNSGSDSCSPLYSRHVNHLRMFLLQPPLSRLKAPDKNSKGICKMCRRHRNQHITDYQVLQLPVPEWNLEVSNLCSKPEVVLTNSILSSAFFLCVILSWDSSTISPTDKHPVKQIKTAPSSGDFLVQIRLDGQA